MKALIFLLSLFAVCRTSAQTLTDSLPGKGLAQPRFYMPVSGRSIK